MRCRLQPAECPSLEFSPLAVTCALTFLGGCGLFYPAAYLQPGLKAAPYELSEHVIGGVLAAGMFGTIWGAISAGILIERVRGAMTMAVAFVVMSLGCALPTTLPPRRLHLP